MDPNIAQDILVEACCDSLATAQAAQSFGAHRIELCGSGDGGTTPSLELIRECRAALAIPMHVMIRPHSESFVYSAPDIETMCRDIERAEAAGVEGIVTGPLTTARVIDTTQLATLISVARSMRVAFHRAFDQTVNAHAALDALLELGVDYILTSGHADTALLGAAQLRALQARAGRRLTILAGGAVRGPTVVALVRTSGVREVHVRSTNPLFVHDVVMALNAERSHA